MLNDIWRYLGTDDKGTMAYLNENENAIYKFLEVYIDGNTNYHPNLDNFPELKTNEDKK